METNGLSVYNVGASLDLDALTQGGTQSSNHGEDDSDDDGDEEEIQQRNAEVVSINQSSINFKLKTNISFFCN
jgi:hypothetical protein